MRSCLIMRTYVHGVKVHRLQVGRKEGRLGWGEVGGGC
jgi:hypothetical protein